MLGDRESSTPRPTAPRINFHEYGRVYLRIVSSLLAREPYDTLADLIEDAKCACAKAHIPYDSQHLTDTVRHIWYSRKGERVVTGVDLPKKVAPEPRLLEPVPGPSREAAAEILRTLRTRLEAAS